MKKEKILSTEMKRVLFCIYANNQHRSDPTGAEVNGMKLSRRVPIATIRALYKRNMIQRSSGYPTHAIPAKDGLVLPSRIKLTPNGLRRAKMLATDEELMVALVVNDL